jgi:hypothetical protein
MASWRPSAASSSSSLLPAPTHSSLTDDARPLVCCRCERDDANYLDAGARLWYASCGHALCERCRKEMYARHRENSCPARGCGATLNAQDFSGQTREMKEFEEEKRVRRRLAAIFNKSALDFGGDADAYARFVEEVEVRVRTLVTGSEREKAEAEAQIAAYRAANQYQISLATAQQQARAVADRERLAAEAMARQAASRSAAEAEGAARRAAETVRRHITDVLLGEKRTLGADERAGLQALKARLLDVQAMKKSGGPMGTGLGAGAGAGAAAVPAGPVLRYVPCPTVFPPRLVSTTHPGWTSLGPHELPPSTLPAHRRAGGFRGEEASAWAAELLGASLLWAPPQTQARS